MSVGLKVILNSVQCLEDVVFRYILSRTLVVLCSEEQNQLCNYVNEHYEEHFCEIICIWANGSGGNKV